eukprot:scaffold90527_cov17-Tisochrysis_lutea.AAC.1
MSINSINNSAKNERYHGDPQNLLEKSRMKEVHSRGTGTPYNQEHAVRFEASSLVCLLSECHHDDHKDSALHILSGRPCPVIRNM